MKTTMFLLFLLVATAAFGQTTAMMSSSLQVANHPMHAASGGMASEQSLFYSSGSVEVAQGERPVGEVVPEAYEMPLGDVARIERQKHLLAKKAQVVWENQARIAGAVQSPVR